MNLSFINEQIAFEKEDGYVSWMSIHHPGILPSSSEGDNDCYVDMAKGDSLTQIAQC
jgi:hypothetical protein